MQTDGGSRGNPGPAGAGAVVLNDRGKILKKANVFLGTMTNNEAEYRAIILGLETLKKFLGKDKVKNLEIEARLDSELVCRQLNGEYQIKEEKLVPLFVQVWNSRVADFKKLRFTHIPREQNVIADQLANEAMDLGTKEQGGLF